MGAEVYGIALEPNTNPSHYNLLKLNINSHIQDITDPNRINTTIKNIGPDVIFHFAAQPLVRLSYVEPYSTFNTNIMGTVNVLEASRNLKNLAAVVIITSDKCYENKEWIWGYRENEPMGGKDPYSASKGCAELVVNAYRNSFFNLNDFGNKHNVLIASARAGNVIGGGDWSLDRLIPDLMKNASKNKITEIRYPNATRPWQHVLEPLSGYLLLGEKLLQGKTDLAEGWNFGPDSSNNLTVLQLIKKTMDFWEEIKFTVTENEHPLESGLLMLDSSKAKKSLNWQPVWEIEPTIKSTVDWYYEFYNSGEVKTLHDIISYVNDAAQKGVIWAKK